MDPYQPPAAELTEPPSREPARRFRVLPVLVGGLVIDFLGSFLVGIGIGLWAARTGTPAQEAISRLAPTPLVLGTTTAIGCGLTVLGGYVAARWAGNRHLLHAAAAGVIPLALTRVLSIDGSGLAPAWLYYAGWILQVPLAVGGGWLAARRAARQPRPARALRGEVAVASSHKENA